MAGIGFSLRKLLNHDSLVGTSAAYTVAGIISGGPWLISILSIVLLSILVSVIPEYHVFITQFQISITYLVAGSLIISGLAGNSFSRFAADQLFSNRSIDIMSNLNGLILVMSIVSGLLSFVFVDVFFPDQSTTYRLLLVSGFVVLSNLWVVIALLTGLKDYTIILKAFFTSYAIIVGLAYGLRPFGLEGFLFGFVVGQLLLLLVLMFALYQEYPTNTVISFHFLTCLKPYQTIIITGFVFSLAVWVDKFLFWMNPSTSYDVIGPLRASYIYDLPIFLAYLCSLPGMAVFLLLIETNFADYYAEFHEAIRHGKSLEFIRKSGEKMIADAFHVIYAIAKIQAITIIIVFQFGEKVMTMWHIPLLYSHLFFVVLIGASLQVILLGIVSILFHMDRSQYVLRISSLFFLLNTLLTILSMYLGPFYYGFGFTIALLTACAYGMYLLSTELTDLEYKVIMLR